MVELGNCLVEIANKIQAQEKLKELPTILGMRVVDGPWEKTKFLDVETVEKTYSAMLIKQDGMLKMVAPFKVTKKENVKK